MATDNDTNTTAEKTKKPGGKVRSQRVRNPIGGSRPIELTPAMFEEAGAHALTWRHMTGILGVDYSTIADRMRDPAFKTAYERGHLNSQTEVIQTLFAHMRNGSLKAAMFLAQAWCHLSLKHEVKHEGEVTTRYVVEVPCDAPTMADWTHLHSATNDADKRERVN